MIAEKNSYPYEVRDPEHSQEWTTVNDTWNAGASVRAFLKLKGYKAREFVDAPRVFEVRHPFTNPDAIHRVRVSVPLRIETHVRHHDYNEWAKVGKPSATAQEETLRAEVFAFVRDVATSYDHDADGHKHGTYCRVCSAEKLLAKLEGRGA